MYTANMLHAQFSLFRLTLSVANFLGMEVWYFLAEQLNLLMKIQRVSSWNPGWASQRLENTVNPAVNKYFMYFEIRIRQQTERDGLHLS